MIRFIKWTYEQFEIGELFPYSFILAFGGRCMFFSKYSGGCSFSVCTGKNLYEINIFSKKKRPELIDFGFDEVSYFEVG